MLLNTGVFYLLMIYARFHNKKKNKTKKQTKWCEVEVGKFVLFFIFKYSKNLKI